MIRWCWHHWSAWIPLKEPLGVAGAYGHIFVWSLIERRTCEKCGRTQQRAEVPDDHA